MKIIYHVLVDYNLDFFFDAKGKLLHFWSQSDAVYESEYMNPLFRILGFEVKEAESSDGRFRETIKRTLIERYGYEETLVEEMIG